MYNNKVNNYWSQHAWVTYDSARDAERKLSLPNGANSNISLCANGKRRSTYGYVWKWLPPPPDLPGEIWVDVTPDVLEKSRIISSGKMDDLFLEIAADLARPEQTPPSQ